MREVILVIGAPCAGKTTFVRENASSGDLIVDFDQFAQDAGSLVEHDHEQQHVSAALTRLKTVEKRVQQMQYGRAWVLRASGRLSTRQRLTRQLKVTRTVVLNPGYQVCMERARMAGRSPATLRGIMEWYRDFDESVNRRV